MKINKDIPYAPIIITFLACFLGQGVLLAIGYPQIDPTSGALFRIHPVTYFLILITILNAIKYKGYISSHLYTNYHKYFFITSFILLFSIFRKLSFGYVLDTLINPMLILFNLQFADEKGMAAIRKVLLAFFVFNASFAVFERIVSTQFFPIYESKGIVYNFRSSALQGHPLNNTLINTFLCLFLTATSNSTLRKVLIIICGIAASVSFGGRSGLAILTLGIILISFKQEAKTPFAIFLPFIITGVVIGATSYLIFFTNFGTRILDAGLSDDSSEVRFMIYDILRQFELQDLFIGRSQEEIDYAMYLEDILIIENFWLIWLLKYGIILFIILSFALIRFLIVVMSKLDNYFKYIIVFAFLVNASANLSLATSTMALNIIVLASYSYTRIKEELMVNKKIKKTGLSSYAFNRL